MNKIYYYCVTIVLVTLVESKTPSDKDLQAVWRLECELGVISDPACPVDGSWSAWSPWSACAGACGDSGLRRRSRACINPAPTGDGLPCAGPAHQDEVCYINNCTIDDYRKLTAGDAARMKALQLLEAVPALTERCFVMECPFEAIEAVLVTENTWQFSAESMWNALQCVTHNLGCPVVGEWGSWSDWSPCGARCGYGLRWRHRKCDTPPPSNVQLDCAGTPLQVDECEGDQCAVHKRNSGGNWSKWGAWTPCSENCSIGIRRRTRTCLETSTPRLFGSWGTHCRGQHDQLEVCENRECKLNGGWSGWGPWGPCSRTCGAGKRSRARSCSRPEPAGSGRYCSGPRTEIGSCHLTPCKTFSHVVAVFNGDSFLRYVFRNKRSTFFHFYIRFLPLSPHGILVRRGDTLTPSVRLSLQKWHLCLDADGQSDSCTVSRLCTRSVVEPAVWHSALITVTTSGTTMRLDDEIEPIKSSFSCDPDLPNDKIDIVVGEKLHGEIQELILNFIPLRLAFDINANESRYCPQSISNIVYEKAGSEESYLVLNDDHYLRLPCISDQNQWQIRFTMKPQSETGTILFMQDIYSNTWLLLHLHNMKLKLKLAVGGYRSESVSSSDYPPNQWLDVLLLKHPGSAAVEVSINDYDRLHVFFEEIENVSNTNGTFEYSCKLKGPHKCHLVLCSDEIFVGGVPDEIKSRIVGEELSSFSGVVASMTLNNVLLNLKEFSVERSKGNIVQVSSRTASVSGSYYETSWGKSKRLNLTCLHTRSARSPNSAHWIYLDSSIVGANTEKHVRSVDNGKVLRLSATGNHDITGFYTCRVYRNKRHRNIVTYGVVGETDNKLSGPDLTTTITVITTLILVLSTLICLFIEGIHDIRNGYGFFRDAHLTPEEEAEAICEYIDQNMDLMVNQHAADVAKARARRIGQEMTGDYSSDFDNSESVMMVNNLGDTEESTAGVPALSGFPEIKNSIAETTQVNTSVFRCVQSFVSSPRHGSISSTKTKLTSASSVGNSSPRLLCSRLLLSKHLQLYKGSFFSKRNIKSRLPRKVKPELFSIQSSDYMSQPLAQKILQKFQDLKSDDV